MNGIDQRQEEIRLVVGRLALQDGHQTFQAHARVNVTRRQRLQRVGRQPVVLHEDQVPDLDDVLAAPVDQLSSGRLAQAGALVDVDLAARPARTQRTHFPKVLPHSEGQDVAVGYSAQCANVRKQYTID